jgi:hypothetical protein
MVEEKTTAVHPHSFDPVWNELLDFKVRANKTVHVFVGIYQKTAVPVLIGYLKVQQQAMRNAQVLWTELRAPLEKKKRRRNSVVGRLTRRASADLDIGSASTDTADAALVVDAPAGTAAVLAAGPHEPKIGDQVRITKPGTYRGAIAVVSEPSWHGGCKVLLGGATKSYMPDEIEYLDGSLVVIATDPITENCIVDGALLQLRVAVEGGDNEVGVMFDADSSMAKQSASTTNQSKESTTSTLDLLSALNGALTETSANRPKTSAVTSGATSSLANRPVRNRRGFRSMATLDDNDVSASSGGRRFSSAGTGAGVAAAGGKGQLSSIDNGAMEHIVDCVVERVTKETSRIMKAAREQTKRSEQGMHARMDLLALQLEKVLEKLDRGHNQLPGLPGREAAKLDREGGPGSMETQLPPLLGK